MSSNNNNTDNTSSLKAAYDSVTGTIQDTVGGLLGNTGDQAEGKAKQDKAQAEKDASHATLKGPGFTATAAGVHKDDPDRTGGSWDQTVGSAKEAVGGLVGSEDLKQAGRQQNLEGQQREAKGQVSDLAGGISDRVTGTVGGAVSGLVGNTSAQKEYEAQHDTGKTAQRGVEHDLTKQAEAAEKK